MAWQKTKVQFLLRNTESGRYYARLFRNSKEVWKSLRTDVFSVAQARLAVEIKDVKKASRATATVESGKATVEAISQSYLKGIQKAVGIKPTTVHYRGQLVAAILRSWPELATVAPKSVTEKDCADWAKRFADTYSPTRYNNGVDTIRGIFNVGIDQGMIFRNPAAGLSKRKPGKKHLELPSREEFTKIVQTVRNSGAWCQTQVGDLIEFLAYSGCRVAEASFVKWSDVENDSIWIHGDPVHGTKGGDRRQIPIIGPMAALLQDLRDNPRYVRDQERTGRVLAIKECQKALTKACETVGVKRLTHHDLRHLFATRCIEAGVDIPTVSRWLGHKDGGALAMKTYGHLRNEHSLEMAKRVTF